MASIEAVRAGAGAAARPKTLRSKVVVGHATVKNDFGLEEAAFNTDEQPETAKQARRKVKQLKKPHILGTARRPWNVSTEAAAPLVVRAGRQLAAHDRPEFSYNYRAEVLPEAPELEHDGVVFARTRSTMAATKRVTEMPVHPTLEGKPEWNGSTTLTPKEKAQREARVTAACLEATMAKSKRVKVYKPPHQREGDRMRELRRIRATGGVDDAATAAAAAAVEMAAKPVTVSYASTVSRRFKKYRHSGTFEKTQFSKNKVWSCCMSEDPDGRGCIVTSVNPDAYNFVSIN